MALRETQSAIDRWLRAPEGVAQALLDEDSAHRARGTESGTAARRLEEMLRGDDALDAVGRLEIYANAYFTRIYGVLQGDFPALEAALGRDRFYDLVTSYLLVEPSRHPSLRYAGSRLAPFLDEHEAAAGLRAVAPWAGELAHLEWLRLEVFDAPNGAALGQDAISLLAPEDFGSIQLKLAPWARPAHYTYPVADIWRPAIRDEPLDEIDMSSRPQQLIAWRKNEEPLHRVLAPLEADALDQVQTGLRFDALCAWAADRVGDAEAPSTAAGWLAQWVADKILVG
jgi:hypothetical protein